MSTEKDMLNCLSRLLELQCKAFTILLGNGSNYWIKEIEKERTELERLLSQFNIPEPGHYYPPKRPKPPKHVPLSEQITAQDVMEWAEREAKKNFSEPDLRRAIVNAVNNARNGVFYKFLL